MDESEPAPTLAKILVKMKPRLTFWAGVALLVFLTPEAVLVYARFGNPQSMPLPLEKLAIKMHNPRVRHEILHSWVILCRAWDIWLGNLRSNAPRLLQTADLWTPDDPLQAALANFVATANELRPETLVPEATVEKRLSVLGESPPAAVLTELRMSRVTQRVEQAGMRVTLLTIQLERWQRWAELRQLLEQLRAHRFTRAAAALQLRLPPEQGSPGYKLNIVRTLKLLQDISRDDGGMLRLAGRWSEWTRLAKELEASGDPGQKAAPSQALAQLVDQSSLAEFADSLAAPLEELRRQHRLLLDSGSGRTGELQPVK